MPHGVADGDARGALLDRGAEESSKRLRLCPGGVLGDVEHGQLVLAGEANRLARVVDHLVDRPSLGVLANGARTDEGGHFDRNPDLLRDIHDGADVDLERARRAERLDAQAPVADFLGQAFHVRHRARSRTRKAKVDRANSELVGEMQEAELVLDVGVAHGGALDTIPERLIVDADRMGWPGRRVDRVPVVDQLRLVRH